MTFSMDLGRVQLMGDVTPALWIEERLWPWRNPFIELIEHEFRVGSLVPEGFAAYARVFNPAQTKVFNSAGLFPGNEPVRWSTVAEWTGRTVHPEMQFYRIANLPDPYSTPPWGNRPEIGNLPVGELRNTVRVLQEFTSSPDNCYFCFWEGYNLLGAKGSKEEPHATISERRYLLFKGALDAILPITDTFGWWRTPNIWWPADRAWCVATDIDLFDTYIGGSEACIKDIVNCPGLEALPTALEARVDPGSDTINI